MNATQPSQITVRVSRVIRAPRERVFEAWVDPDLRRKWWRHGSGLKVCAIDARPGGRYRMTQIGGCPEEIQPDVNFEWIMDGEFLEVVRPSRIVFTWNVNHDPPVVNNRVTIELREVPGGTEVTLTHEGLPSEQLRDGTDDGWTSLMESMARLLERA
jgi:uncharacterized protein YndB with AHSA1/START domain